MSGRKSLLRIAGTFFATGIAGLIMGNSSVDPQYFIELSKETVLLNVGELFLRHTSMLAIPPVFPVLRKL